MGLPTANKDFSGNDIEPPLEANTPGKLWQVGVIVSCWGLCDVIRCYVTSSTI